MGRNSWILVALLASLLVVVAYRFEEYQVAGDYVIYSTATCDSTREQCFVMDCDPEVDEGCDQTPYKKITVHAGTAPVCALEHTCEAFVCPENDSSCEITLCSEDVLEDGEVCMDSEVPDTTSAVEESAETMDETATEEVEATETEVLEVSEE